MPDLKNKNKDGENKKKEVDQDIEQLRDLLLEAPTE